MIVKKKEQTKWEVGEVSFVVTFLDVLPISGHDQGSKIKKKEKEFAEGQILFSEILASTWGSCSLGEGLKKKDGKKEQEKWRQACVAKMGEMKSKEEWLLTSQ